MGGAPFGRSNGERKTQLIDVYYATRARDGVDSPHLALDPEMALASRLADAVRLAERMAVQSEFAADLVRALYASESLRVRVEITCETMSTAMDMLYLRRGLTVEVEGNFLVVDVDPTTSYVSECDDCGVGAALSDLVERLTRTSHAEAERIAIAKRRAELEEIPFLTTARGVFATTPVLVEDVEHVREVFGRAGFEVEYEPPAADGAYGTMRFQVLILTSEDE